MAQRLEDAPHAPERQVDTPGMQREQSFQYGVNLSHRSNKTLRAPAKGGLDGCPEYG
jgi:hypothetical protein